MKDILVKGANTVDVNSQETIRSINEIKAQQAKVASLKKINNSLLERIITI